MRARGSRYTLLTGPRDPDRGRLELVPRPVPGHLAALRLLPRRCSAARRTRSSPTCSRSSARSLLRLDPPARARARARRAPQRDRDHPHHALDVRRHRRPRARLRQPRGRVPDRRRRARRDAADRRRSASAIGTRDRRLGLLGRRRPSTRAPQISGTVAVLAWLGNINVADPDLQPAPAFPLDGGRIARAIAWKRDRRPRARRPGFAARLGQGFAFVFIALGIFLIAAAAPSFGGIWLGADRLDARPVGAGDRRPQRAQPADRRPARSPT